ncbi:MAG: hypothetical protein C3L25_13855 [Candidatus Sedimenticola endophacoides]|nr:MAG: hypothetical protein C3L26_13935 [Candidatus Sedimenticola endophacoides]PUE00319.1 MAG: hypothetical protein C3L25_13855 [Candidatus Sedimenticola endophacoides]
MGCTCGADTEVYNYFRTYDPATGRYLESDPIGLDGGLNTYSYAYENPLYWIDEDGLRALGGTRGIPIPVPGFTPGPTPGNGEGTATGRSGAPPRDTPRDVGRDLGRPNGRGRNQCVIKCDGVQIKGSGQGKGVDANCPACPAWIYGWGKGSTPNQAWNNAWDAADANSPRGCQKRHCRGIAGSCKGWKGGKR